MCVGLFMCFYAFGVKSKNIVFSGSGDYIPSRNGHFTVQPDRPHTAGHGGHVPGERTTQLHVSGTHTTLYNVSGSITGDLPCSVNVKRYLKVISSNPN